MSRKGEPVSESRSESESELMSLGQLVHELEGPLVFLEAQLTALSRATTCRETAERCLTEVRALRGLVVNFVPLTRGALERSCFSLGPVLERLAVRFEAAAEARGVALRLDATSVTASGDPRATEHVLSNLVDNAVKFTPRGGAVRIRAYQHDGRVRTEVLDGGPGLSAEERERLFEPFYRSNRDAPGFGLGLTIAKRLAERQGGELLVEPAPNGAGAGARFTLVLDR